MDWDNCSFSHKGLRDIDLFHGCSFSVAAGGKYRICHCCAASNMRCSSQIKQLSLPQGTIMVEDVRFQDWIKRLEGWNLVSKWCKVTYLEFRSESLELQLRWNAVKKSAIRLIDPVMSSAYSRFTQSPCWNILTNLLLTYTVRIKTNYLKVLLLST